MKTVYTLKRPGAPLSSAFKSTCKLETALFVALGYSVRKKVVA